MAVITLGGDIADSAAALAGQARGQAERTRFNTDVAFRNADLGLRQQDLQARIANQSRQTDIAQTRLNFQMEESRRNSIMRAKQMRSNRDLDMMKFREQQRTNRETFGLKDRAEQRFRDALGFAREDEAFRRDRLTAQDERTELIFGQQLEKAERENRIGSATEESRIQGIEDDAASKEIRRRADEQRLDPNVIGRQIEEESEIRQQRIQQGRDDVDRRQQQSFEEAPIHKVPGIDQGLTRKEAIQWHINQAKQRGGLSKSQEKLTGELIDKFIIRGQDTAISNAGDIESIRRSIGETMDENRQFPAGATMVDLQDAMASGDAERAAAIQRQRQQIINQQMAGDPEVNRMRQQTRMTDMVNQLYSDPRSATAGDIVKSWQTARLRMMQDQANLQDEAKRREEEARLRALQLGIEEEKMRANEMASPLGLANRVGSKFQGNLFNFMFGGATPHNMAGLARDLNDPFDFGAQ